MFDIDLSHNQSHVAIHLFAELLSSDPQSYGKIAYMAVVMVFGSVLNSYVLTKLTKQMSSKNARRFCLHFFLCICDLSNSIIYTGTQIGQLVTISFSGGSFLCKSLKSVELLSVFMSSNITACISLNRAITIVSPAALCKRTYTIRVKIMTAVSLAVALWTSIPQFFMWELTTIKAGNQTFTHCQHVYMNPEVNEGSYVYEYLWMAYSVAMILLRFWLPFLLILVSYGVILYKMGTCNLTSLGYTKGRTQPQSPVPTMTDVVIYTSSASSSDQSGRSKQALKVVSKHVRFDTKIVSTPLTTSRVSARSLQRVVPKLRKVTGLLVSTYVLLWLPYNVVLLYNYFVDMNQTYVDALSWLAELFLVKCVLNPIMWMCVVFRHG